MRHTRPLVLALGCLATSTFATSVFAAPPDTIDMSSPTPLIAYGEPAVACAWPTAVSIAGAGLCSGTLIHPRVVVYAAHCGGNSKTIHFGEDALAPARSVTASDCRAYPEYAGADDQSHDWAYCVLDEAITELPVTPPLFGCETTLLEVGREVALVGYGADVVGDGGIKRWAATTLVAVTPSNNTTLVGNPNLAGVPSICLGDSGGPAFVQLDDGSWRTFGIASTVVGDCGGYGAHSMLSGAISWIEQDSDIDVTPCHAADGSWAPGPACASAYAHAAGLASGSWPDWCSGTTTSDRIRSCGPAWDEFDAKLPPSVEIESPSDGESFLENLLVPITVAAVKHPDGYAVARVHLRVDGAILATDEVDPWVFEVTSFSGAGVYELVAIAEDWAGNEVASAPIEIGFGVEVPDGESDGESGSSTGETDDAPPLDASGSGCACAVTREHVMSPSIPMLVIVSLRLLQRRRARATIRRDRDHDRDAHCPVQNQALALAGVAGRARDRARG